MQLHGCSVVHVWRMTAFVPLRCCYSPYNTTSYWQYAPLLVLLLPFNDHSHSTPLLAPFIDCITPNFAAPDSSHCIAQVQGRCRQGCGICCHFCSSECTPSSCELYNNGYELFCYQTMSLLYTPHVNQEYMTGCMLMHTPRLYPNCIARIGMSNICFSSSSSLLITCLSCLSLALSSATRKDSGD